ncbi:MAG: alpha/beta fold hydrolase [Solirubrobacteraceae bacterium]
MSAGLPSTSDNSRALYIDVAPDPVFAVLHEAVGAAGDAAVLFVSPFGWEDMASYRARREWAQALAAAGVPALRFDMPGSGDSAGAPTDPDRVAAWLDAIDGAARWLRHETGRPRIVAIGMGLGALLAVRATERGAPIDDLVLWGGRASGRALVRELKAFSRMEGTLDDATEGGLPVAGYLLSDQTAADLGAIDLSTLDFAGPVPGRALLLDREGAPADEALAAALAAAGTAIATAPGPGYGDLLDWIHHSVDTAVVVRVSGWIGEGQGSAPGAPAEAPPAPGDNGAMTVADGVVESPVLAAGLFGIVARPQNREAEDLCLVLVNPGPQRRIGPNRMWVEMARRWAARGVPTVRLDIPGLGDSEGDVGRFRETAGLYVDEIVTELRLALDGLVAAGLPDRFVVGGLCSGAFWSFHAAAQDDRVVGALMLNPSVLVWDQFLSVARNARAMRRKLLRPRSWARALTGRSDYGTHVATLKGIATRPGGAPVIGRAPQAMRAASVEPLLDRLGGKRALMLFAGRPALLEELETEGILAGLDRWPGISVEHIPADGDTHTLRPVRLQREAHRIVDEALDEIVRG